MAKSRIDGLLERQAEELAQLEQANVASVLGAYDDARRSLHERLRAVTPGATPETEHRLRVMLAQAEQGVAELQGRLGVVMSAAEAKAHRRSMAHLLGLVKAQEPSFIDSGGLVEVGVVRRLAGLQALGLHRFSVARYGTQVIDAIQRELVSGVVQGMTVQQLADRVAAAGGSVFDGMRGRAMLIARMETTRAYNDAHLEGIRELDEQDPDPDDPWLKKVDEYFDLRNHPFSRAVNGRTARPQDPFVVPVADVQAAATALRKPLSGVLWAQAEGNYVGQNLPAHFHERGRIIAWRASWGPSKASPPPPRSALPAAAPAVPALAAVPDPVSPAKNVLHEKLRGPSGSNDGGVFRGLDGVERYVKYYDDPAQAYGEHVSNAVYTALKIAAPSSQVFEHEGRTVYASEIIPGAKNLGDVIDQDVSRQVLDGFAADVLLANWDVIGLGLDNIVVAGGKVHRIDNGGALLSRAMGARKPSDPMSLHSLREWSGYLDPSINASYARVFDFAGVKHQEAIPRLKKQLQGIAKLKGRWDAFVTKTAPDWLGPDRDQAVAMLEARTDELEAQLARLAALLPATDRKQVAKLKERDYKAFSSETEIRGYSPQLEATRADLTSDEAQAVGNYTSIDYDPINKGLRASPQLVQYDVPHIDAAIAKQSLPDDLVAWRGANIPLLQGLETGALRAGDSFTDAGFVSSSLSQGQAFEHNRFILRIRVPRESRALWVDDISSNPGEFELLLGRESKFTILSAKKKRDGKWHLDVLLLPPK